MEERDTVLLAILLGLMFFVGIVLWYYIVKIEKCCSKQDDRGERQVTLAELHRMRRRRENKEDEARRGKIQQWDAIPTTFPNELSADGDTLECSICMCEYDASDVIRVLPCKHHFHKNCVDEWFAASRMIGSCPQCRATIPTALETHNAAAHTESTLEDL